MTMKKSAFEEMCDTCFSKVLPFLVNIHNDINYPLGEFILQALARGAIHPDIGVLGKFLRGVVPNTFKENVPIQSEISKVGAYFILKQT